MDERAAEANFLLEKARDKLKTDPDDGMSMLLTTKTMYPNNFSVQYELYKWYKAALDYKEAAEQFQKCYGIVESPQETPELAEEVTALVSVLRDLDAVLEPLQEFYMKTFQHLTLDVQLEILQMTVDYKEQIVKQYRLVMVILRKFPAVRCIHMPKLLEMIACMKTEPLEQQAMLLDEVMPLVCAKTPEMDPTLVTQLYKMSLGCFMRQIMDDPFADTSQIWTKIFNVLVSCASTLKWEQFLPFSEVLEQNTCWTRLQNIANKSPSDSTQVLFYATTLFIYCLHSFITKCSPNVGIKYVLVEGCSDRRVQKDNTLQPPQITVTTAASKGISMAFSHATQCWQLLNTAPFQCEFKKLLLSLPLAKWTSRFLVDVSIYHGKKKEAKKLMSEVCVDDNLISNLQTLSLDMLNNTITFQGLECILKIFAELPSTPGKRLELLSGVAPRHTLFMPLTRQPLIQYCAKVLANALAGKLTKPTVTDRLIGDLLVLLQLEYPDDSGTVDEVFAAMTQRGHFSYKLFSTYIVSIDFVEQFMFIADTQKNFRLDLEPVQPLVGGQRRLRDTHSSNRSIIRQQVNRANDDVFLLLVDFIKNEKLHLMQHLNA